MATKLEKQAMQHFTNAVVKALEIHSGKIAHFNEALENDEVPETLQDEIRGRVESDYDDLWEMILCFIETLEEMIHS